VGNLETGFIITLT